MKVVTNSAKETKRVAEELVKKLISAYKSASGTASKSALVVALEGELGAGKTTFIKGFSRALGVREKILSPTFVIIHRHRIRNQESRIRNLYHIDCYRLKSEKDLLKLGVKKIFANPENIVLIEWADRVKKIIPKNAVWVHFSHLEKSTRRITIE